MKNDLREDLIKKKQNQNERLKQIIDKLINATRFDWFTYHNREKYFFIEASVIQEVFINSEIEISKLFIKNGLQINNIKSEIIKNENIELLKFLIDECPKKIKFFDHDLIGIKNKEILKMIANYRIKEYEEKIKPLKENIQLLKEITN
jgi:mRNA-degrading endonuclease YafQ of YafQ-DinJ toxin-antitoxin module